MKILNFGSLNIDKVYQVEHFVEPGETILIEGYETFCGGKGLNQSVALKLAGANVWHAGAVGQDGVFLKKMLEEVGVNTEYIDVQEGASGHAVIEVDRSGQNRIMVCPGTNGEIKETFIDLVLGKFEENDILLIQNEISNVSYIIKKAHEAGMKIAFNPSPINDSLFTYPLELVDYFILNEVEGKALAKSDSEEPELILSGLKALYPQSAIILTLGSEGVYYQDGGVKVSHPACKVNVVDTTAAGDTFCGYFLAMLANNKEIREALHYASLASGIVVGKKGASSSIPKWDETVRFESQAVFRQ